MAGPKRNIIELQIPWFISGPWDLETLKAHGHGILPGSKVHIDLGYDDLKAVTRLLIYHPEYAEVPVGTNPPIAIAFIQEIS